MSHLTTVKTEIRSVEALREACTALGLTLQAGGRVRFYAGESDPVDCHVQLPGHYDLGFTRQADGTYGFVADEELIGGRSGTDDYGRGDAGRQILGEDCRRLRQEYSYAVLQAEARRKGLQISRQQEGNRIKVVLTGRNL